jgi:uncharacterized coiled-coil protein SlyX
MDDDLEERLTEVEQHLAHSALTVEDLSAMLNTYRQDLDRLKAQVTRLEGRLSLLLEQAAPGQGDDGASDNS